MLMSHGTVHRLHQHLQAFGMELGEVKTQQLLQYFAGAHGTGSSGSLATSEEIQAVPCAYSKRSFI